MRAADRDQRIVINSILRRWLEKRIEDFEKKLAALRKAPVAMERAAAEKKK